MAGKLYMIPCPIVEYHTASLPPSTIEIIHKVRYYITERARTTRRFIKKTDPPYTIDSLTIIEMDKHHPGIHIQKMLDWLQAGYDVGIVSESGCPGIADPGALYAAAAQAKDFRVVPLVGPSSILLALMAAGMNGQNFAFTGYLPIKNPELKRRIRELERNVLQQNQTQIFIETPYRNDKLIHTLIREVSPHLRLCIAVEISGPDEFIRTETIDQWKSHPPTIGKKNAIFILGK